MVTQLSSKVMPGKVVLNHSPTKVFCQERMCSFAVLPYIGSPDTSQEWLSEMKEKAALY